MSPGGEGQAGDGPIDNKEADLGALAQAQAPPPNNCFLQRHKQLMQLPDNKAGKTESQSQTQLGGQIQLDWYRQLTETRLETIGE